MRWFDRIFRRSIYGELSQELSRCTEEKTEYGMQAVPRREFLKCFGLAATWSSGLVLPQLHVPSVAPAKGNPPNSDELFHLLPSTATGISWRHVNDRSPQAYLP